jgi:hypothetical protein
VARFAIARARTIETMPRTIIVEASQETSCPRCSHTFALSEGISRQTIERLAEAFEKDFAEKRRQLETDLAAEAKKVAEQEAAMQVRSLQQEAAAAKAAAAESKGQLEKAREEARLAAREQFETERQSLAEALAEKAAALESQRNGELDLRRQLRDAQEKDQAREVEYQRKLDEEKLQIETRARSSIGEEFQRKEAQLRAQIESAQREAADLKRKLEQGSQQTQGEALELGLEATLRAAFPLDEIVPVPKGMTGADLLQRVRSPSGQACGTIIWETKETRNWTAGWIPKLKDDQQAAGAEIAVLVTSAMPSDTREPFVREADVWVTRVDAARPLAEALRGTLLELQKLRLANTGRNEKMELIYNYICSPQFGQRVRSIYDGFEGMRRELDQEKAAMTRIWKRREAQLDRMRNGLLSVVGDLQGIGQEAVPQLEEIAALPAGDEPEEGDAES